MLYRLVLKALSLLPRPVAQWLGRCIGRIAYQADLQSARVSRTNLRLCYPGKDIESLVRDSLVSSGQTLMETPAIWLGNPEKVDNWIGQVHGEDLLREAVDVDRGLLLLLPHLGNWEIFNVFYRRYGRMTALYQPPRRKSMQDVMAEVRARNGNEMVPTTRAGITRLFRVLQEGGTVVVLPDQVPASGRFTSFFGQQALTDELAHRLLKKSGARALGICFVRDVSGQFDVVIKEPSARIYGEVDESLIAVNELMEDFARQVPGQYQWEYKRFRERPAGKEKLYRYNKQPAVHD